MTAAMAIEFRCPYCEATIRVADSAPGRVGKCPKCNTKMVVPKPSAALPPSLPLNFGGTAAPPPVVPDDEPVLLEENDADVPDIEFAPAGPSLTSGSPATTAEPAPAALPTNLVPVIDPAAPVRRVIKKRKAKRPPQVMWVIATVMGLGLSIAAGYVVYLQVFNGKFTGDLHGTVIDEVKLPPATIPRATITLVSSALDPLLKDLETQPVPLVSDLMEVQIGGNKDGLTITVGHGPHTRWYRVDAKSHPQLAEFSAKNEKRWSAARTKKLDQAANQFIRDYQKVRTKEADASVMPPYRDSLALTALVKGLGEHVVAVVGRTVYPCVYEQADGSLYFLLPAKLRSFTLQGKPLADGKPGPLQAEFRVIVKADPAAAPEPVDEPQAVARPEPEAMEATAESEETPADTKDRRKKRAKAASTK